MYLLIIEYFSPSVGIKASIKAYFDPYNNHQNLWAYVLIDGLIYGFCFAKNVRFKKYL